MRVLVWQVHGSWTTSFVQGPHEYLIPTSAGRDEDGKGRARAWNWPANAVEVPLPELRDTEVDVVVLQRVRELHLLRTWAGRRAGIDVPAVFVEHNTPSGSGAFTEHPLANQHDIPIIHVTHFNNMMWDCGRAPTTVIEHGIVDPGHQYSGRAERAGVVINDPLRRGRAVGTDLLPKFASAAPLDVFGRNVTGLGRTSLGRHGRLTAHENLPQRQLHAQLAECRAYLHTTRWTSLGLSLVEAMHMGMPVVALATTEVPRAVPSEVGSTSTRPDELVEALRALIADPDLAHAKGRRAREWALERYGLKRFLSHWDRVLERMVASRS